jgi:hypothetical protein
MLIASPTQFENKFPIVIVEVAFEVSTSDNKKSVLKKYGRN